MKVLVVHDDPSVNRELRITIEALGYEVAHAATSETAQEMLETRDIVALICGWEVDGTPVAQLAQRLRGDILQHYTPLLVASETSGYWRKPDAMNAGVTDLVQLPPNEAELRAQLGRCVRLRMRETVLHQSLYESNRRYLRLFENTHDAVWTMDAEATITSVNRRLCELLGYEEHEMVGENVMTFVTDESRAARPPEKQRWRVGVAEHFEMRFQRRDATEGWASAAILPVPDGCGRFGALGLVADITDRRSAEQDRDTIFELSVDMLAVFDRDARFKRANPAWERTLGYTEDELRGTSAWHYILHEDRSRAMADVAPTAAGVTVHDSRARWRAKDGSIRWLSFNLAPVTSDGDSYCVVRDITAQVDAEDELQQIIEVMQANSIALSQQNVEIDQLRIEAEYLANHDVLTGTLNRRAWFANAVHERPTAVAIFDIDFFKRVNDTYGHPSGDVVLREVARRMEATLPNGASLGRIGGEEFAVLFTGPFGEARLGARRCIEAVTASPIQLPCGETVTVTLSAGLAAWRPDGKLREESLAHTYEDADRALYAAKGSGRRQLIVHAHRAA